VDLRFIFAEDFVNFWEPAATSDTESVSLSEKKIVIWYMFVWNDQSLFESCNYFGFRHARKRPNGHCWVVLFRCNWMLIYQCSAV